MTKISNDPNDPSSLDSELKEVVKQYSDNGQFLFYPPIG